MNQTNQKEFEKVMEWIHSKTCYNFPEIDQNMNSYFESCESANLYELDFSNIKDLKEIFIKGKQVVQDSDIDLVCAVATFKHRPKKDMEKTGNMSGQGLSDIIYNF